MHPVFAAHDALGILIIDDFRVAYLADEKTTSHVHQSVDIKGLIRCLALRADVSLVVKFL